MHGENHLDILDLFCFKYVCAEIFPADKQTLILTGKVLAGCDTVLSLVPLVSIYHELMCQI